MNNKTVQTESFRDNLGRNESWMILLLLLFTPPCWHVGVRARSGGTTPPRPSRPRPAAAPTRTPCCTSSGASWVCCFCFSDLSCCCCCCLLWLFIWFHLQVSSPPPKSTVSHSYIWTASASAFVNIWFWRHLVADLCRNTKINKNKYNFMFYHQWLHPSAFRYKKHSFQNKSFDQERGRFALSNFSDIISLNLRGFIFYTLVLWFPEKKKTKQQNQNQNRVGSD